MVVVKNIRSVDMKTSINVIKGLVEKYPNDEQLGRVVRDFIKQLQSKIQRKREENNELVLFM